MLQKLINIFKTKSDLVDLVEEQSARIQELEDSAQSRLKLVEDTLKNSESLVKISDRTITLNKELLLKIEKLENEKELIKQELKSLLENN
jgi:hypothetical protein